MAGFRTRSVKRQSHRPELIGSCTDFCLRTPEHSLDDLADGSLGLGHVESIATKYNAQFTIGTTKIGHGPLYMALDRCRMNGNSTLTVLYSKRHIKCPPVMTGAVTYLEMSILLM